MHEMEEKNKYMKQANNYAVEKEELKNLNTQLTTQIGSLMNTIDQLQKRLKVYEDLTADKKDKYKKPKDNEVKGPETVNTDDSKRILKGKKDIKDINKKTSIVQI